MAARRHIELVARRQEDLHDGRPDYLVYASDRQLGRIYQQLSGMARTEQWFWGVQGVLTSAEIGRLQGFATSFDHAEAQLRTAFDL